MEHFKKINDFLEGSLPSSQEDELFAVLAVDTSVRNEMKKLLALNSTFNYNRDFFRPDTASKSAIFAAVGLEIPHTGSFENAGQSWLNSCLQFLGKYSQGIVTGLTTVTLTSLFFIFFMLPSNKNSAPEPSNRATIPYLLQPDSEKSNSIVTSTKQFKRNDHITSNERANPIPVIEHPEKNRDEISQIKNDNMDENQSTNLNNFDTESNNELLMIGNKSNLSENDFYDMVSVDKNNSQSKLLNKQFKKHGDYWKGLSLELSGIKTFSMPQANINPANSTEMNNTALALLYMIKNGFSAGIDIRQENFFLQFTGSDWNGINKLYETQPNFTTFSALLRYEKDIIGKNTPIFGQVSYGANSGGSVGRVMLGAKYLITDGISIIFGSEYNRMFYSYQGKAFNSSKAGIYYGIIYNFK
ncbi:MAG: hypothetical protein HW421_3118 [Ignavibacteria bacterium]|nr:hypothetical protein [Ignavibacteria bacterium]